MNWRIAFGIFLVAIGVAVLASDRSAWLSALGLFDLTAGALVLGAAARR